MNGMIGRTVDAATRGLGFLRQYPFLVAAEIAVVTALATMVARAEELIRQQLAGRAAAKSATSHRATLREGLRANLLRPLARVAEVVAHEQPELRGLYRLPKGKTKHQTFRAAARRMLEEAVARREAFLQHGLPEGLLEELGAQLDRYDASVEQSNAGTRAHVEATAELDEVAAQITALLKQLDGMNQFRFRNDPEKLAGWESARNVPWPVRDTRGVDGDPGAAAPAA